MNTTLDSPYGLERPARHNSSYRIRSKATTPDTHGSKIRLLNKQIKNNDVTQILGGSDIAASGARQDLVVKDAERREIVANIAMLRKRLDDTRDLCTKKEQDTNRLKFELDGMRSNEDHLLGDSLKTSSKLGQLKNTLELQKLKLEEALMGKKTYEGMLERMKKDSLVDKVKQKHLEKELSSRSRSLNTENQTTRKNRQFKVQAQNVFGEMIKQMEDEDRKRQESLLGFERAVVSKEMAERSREDRIRRTENLQEVVAKEIVHDSEKQYKTLFLVHKFLNTFLKKQMDTEMRTHETVEHAFQRIRAAVGVTDAQQFVEKFMKREESYSDLLVSISNYEKKVEQAKKQNEELQAKLQLAKERNNVLEKRKTGNKNSEQQTQEAFKEFHTKIDVFKTAKNKLEQTYSWAIKLLVKLDKAKGINKNNYHEQLPKNSADLAFKKVVEVVRGHLKDIGKNNYSRVLDDIDYTSVESEILKKDFLKKNIRVKAEDLTSERRRSGSSRGQSRGGSPNPWETSSVEQRHHTHQTDQEQEEESFDDVMIERQRKEIKTKMAQALLIKKAQEKLAKELEKQQ